MMTLELDATVSEGGRMTLQLTSPISAGIHRIRLTLLDIPDASPPKTFFLGRPVYDAEDMRAMSSELPSEDAWALEQGVS